MNDLLTEHQRAIAARVLDEEERHRRHLVVALSGAHAYGFPSPDSDLDLKSIHLDATSNLLALEPRHTKTERLEVLEGIEIDYSSNELREVLIGILNGNGNYLERVLGHLAVRGSPLLEELRPLARRSLSRRVHRHYRGFASGQLKEWEKTGGRSAKKLLYVLRTALTGTHLLLTGEMQIDLNAHLVPYGFEEARELIEQKRRGELAELPEPLIERWRKEVGRVLETLDAALVRSPLPAEPQNPPELNAWLLSCRRAEWR